MSLQSSWSKGEQVTAPDCTASQLFITTAVRTFILVNRLYLSSVLLSLKLGQFPKYITGSASQGRRHRNRIWYLFRSIKFLLHGLKRLQILGTRIGLGTTVYSLTLQGTKLCGYLQRPQSVRGSQNAACSLSNSNFQQLLAPLIARQSQHAKWFTRTLDAKHSVPTSQETQRTKITRTDRLIELREIICLFWVTLNISVHYTDKLGV
jgi:hypothetical protein